MAGRKSPVSPLASRKQLLVAESEINRVRLAEEWQAMTQGVRGLAHRTKTVAAWAAPAVVMVAGLAAFWRWKSAPAASQSTWLQKMVNGARLASKCWFAFRAARQQADGQPPAAQPEAGRAGNGSRPPHFTTMLLEVLLLGACCTLTQRVVGAPLFASPAQTEANPAPASSGPTLRLDYGRGDSPGIPVADFMYFVPLISLEPVSVVKSAGNTQRARMVSTTRSFKATSFLVTCEFEFAGEGNQQYVFDHSEKVRRHARALEAGATLDHQLSSINVEGAGGVNIEVGGTMSNGVPVATEVRLRFHGRGQPSPVSIGLHDLRYLEGSARVCNESVARVKTLGFRSRPGPSKMDITVASVKRKDAGNGLWQDFVGDLKGTTANLFLEPIAVAAAGSEAMLSFGLALALEAPAFTFPRAKNLKAASD
jgi:hypothetical protein